MLVRILISGSSGLIGRSLCAQLPRYRHSITRLVRFGPASGTASAEADGPRAPAADAAAWDPAAGLLDSSILSGVDAVICLNGSSLGEKRWDRKLKQEILESRVQPTRLLAETMAALPEQQRPAVFISCSGVNFYGRRPAGSSQDESAPNGEGFLAEVCRQWEEASRPAAAAGVRVLNMRLGVVLSADEGALSRLVWTINKGIGGVLGSGRQEVSWVCIHDVPGAVQQMLETPALSGPVNLCAPKPVSNAELMKTTAAVIGKRLAPPVPAFAVRLVLGEMADELLLGSQHAVPKKLLDSGFSFQYPELKPALSMLLQGA